MSMDIDIKTYINELLRKSEEAYLLALEIINKPTIKYRTEGFCFFICNAWELLLKAFIIRTSGIDALYYKDKSGRTLGISDCIDKVFTSTTDKVKTNLSHIVQIRNRATHLILPEYDYEFAPLFQKNISNFNNFFMKHFKDYELNASITPFIAINKNYTSTPSGLNIIDDAGKFLSDLKLKITDDGLIQNVILTVTKKVDDADLTVAIEKDSTNKATMIRVPKDINALFPYTFKNIIKAIQESLSITLGANHGFTHSSFLGLRSDLKVLDNQNWAYKIDYSSGIYKYSQEFVDYVVHYYINDLGFREKYKKKDNQPQAR